MADLHNTGIVTNADVVSKYGKAIKDAGCVTDSDYGGIALKDDPFSVDGCHTMQAYAGLAKAALEDVKDGAAVVASDVSATYKFVAKQFTKGR